MCLLVKWRPNQMRLKMGKKEKEIKCENEQFKPQRVVKCAMHERYASVASVYLYVYVQIKW